MKRGRIDKKLTIEDNSFADAIKRAQGHDVNPEKVIPDLNKKLAWLKENLFASGKMDNPGKKFYYPKELF